MSQGDFTTIERTDPMRRSFAILKRLTFDLWLLPWVFLPTLLLSLVAVFIPQVFLWLSGTYADCAAGAPCIASITRLSIAIRVTLGFLVFLAITSLVIRFLSWALFELSGQLSTAPFHRTIVAGLSRVRTTYFDENPSGRLINRVVRDWDSIRNGAVTRMGDFMQGVLEVSSTSGAVFIAHPTGALLIIPLLVVFFHIQINVAPMLQRCALLRSARFGEVLHRETDFVEGARTFVMYGAERALIARLGRALRAFTDIHVTRVEVEAWGRFWTGVVSAVYAATMVALVGVALARDFVTVPVAAVIITVIFRLSPAINVLSWVTTNLLESAAITRRVYEIVDLPHETTEEGAVARTPQRDGAVPTGDIRFTDFAMSFRPNTPAILENFSLTLPFGKRIGIVGRTGSGKSSVLQSLYRMVFVRKGEVTIGEQSIYSFPVNTIRDLFSVVPQDPYLFEGSIASNLDRQGGMPVIDLNHALMQVGIRYPLNFPVLEGGRNLSLGERQLICLARALLQKRPYLFLDEPTSAVDSITDRDVQAVLRGNTGIQTLITIAHRLDTLTDYDMVVELADGRVVRQGTPREILATL